MNGLEIIHELVIVGADAEAAFNAVWEVETNNEYATVACKDKAFYRTGPDQWDEVKLTHLDN